MREHLIFDSVVALGIGPIPAGPQGSAALVEFRSWPQACRRNRRTVRTSRDNGHQLPVSARGRPGHPGHRNRTAYPAVRTRWSRSRWAGWIYHACPSGGDGGPFGSRRNLILAIVGGVVLVGAAIGIGFWLARPDTTATPPPVDGERPARLGVGGAQLRGARLAAPGPVRITVPVTLVEWRFGRARRAPGRPTDSLRT